MAFYDKFPYTNFQELNLDWLTQEVSKVRDNRDASDASAAAALASEQAAKASQQAAAASQQEAAESEQNAAGSEAASAEYLEQIGTHTAGAVADWLKENLQPTTPPVDVSLTVSGAAADAKVTGDRISDLNQAKNYIIDDIGVYHSPKFTVQSGDAHSSQVDRTTVNFKSGDKAYITVKSNVSGTRVQLLFSSEGTTIQALNVTTNANPYLTTFENDCDSLGAYIAAISTDAEYEIIIENAESYNKRISENERKLSLINSAQIDGMEILNPDNFEVGTISMNSNGWTYSNDSYRIRTKKNYELILNVGDIVRLKDYTKAQLIVGFQISTASTNGYGIYGWLAHDYVCEYGGRHAILIKSTPEAGQQNIDYLFSQLEIIRYHNSKTDADILRATTNPLINSINHRGFNRTAPENTLPAFKMSKSYGFSHIETDVEFTSDGVPVCLHDPSINRTARNSDGTQIAETVNINEITYAQVLDYDFGIAKAERYAGTPIPTFEEMIKTARNVNISVYAELKSVGATHALVKGLVALAEKYGMKDRVTWISYEPSWLADILEEDPNARIGLLCNSITATVISNAQALNSEKVFIDAGSYTSEEVSMCKNAGIPLEVFMPNSVLNVLKVPDYASGISSDLYCASVVRYDDAMNS